MLNDLCIFVSEWLDHPNILEVTNKLRRDQICTGTQCYESLDALIPMTSPPTSNFEYVVAFSVMMVLLVSHRQIYGKPSFHHESA